MRSPIRTIDHQTVPMKVDLGWITPKKMQHITLGIRRLYHLVCRVSQLQAQKILRRHCELEQELKGSLSVIML
jgi:hypothetical protein